MKCDYAVLPVVVLREGWAASSPAPLPPLPQTSVSLCCLRPVASMPTPVASMPTLEAVPLLLLTVLGGAGPAFSLGGCTGFSRHSHGSAASWLARGLLGGHGGAMLCWPPTAGFDQGTWFFTRAAHPQQAGVALSRIKV